MLTAILTIVVAVGFGWLCGWLHAHSVVAKECEKLERFYVGDKVFECTLKK